MTSPWVVEPLTKERSSSMVASSSEKALSPERSCIELGVGTAGFRCGVVRLAHVVKMDVRGLESVQCVVKVEGGLVRYLLVVRRLLPAWVGVTKPTSGSASGSASIVACGNDH